MLENVLLPTLADGVPPAAAVERARVLLDRVGLANRLEHLLLADEPTGNLDRHTAATVSRLLLELQAQEQTMLLVVTHSLDLAGMLQRRLELNDGQLV